MSFECHFVSPLAKVFCDEAPPRYPAIPLTGFMNEMLALQFAFKAGEGVSDAPLQVTVSSSVPVRVYCVLQVPVRLAAQPGSDDDYLRRTPGLYPDLLRDVARCDVRVYPGQWQALWLDIEPGEGSSPGPQTLRVALADENGTVLADERFEWTLLEGHLPQADIKVTRWLHFDCLATHYKQPVFSDAHFDLIARFLDVAVKRGQNMLLVPIHTPPLDTRVGGERLTTQLVDVTVLTDGRYAFKFDKLSRFIAMAQEAGIRHFEMAHLVSQWGSFCAPKIMAQKDGEEIQLFGWDTPALGEDYLSFLDQYVDALTDELSRLGILEQSYFHLTDEPSREHLPRYLTLRDRVKPHLKGRPIMDALSDVDFFLSGAVDLPIPANDHIEPFVTAGVPDLWTYYCVAQKWQVTNTFIAQPGQRTRALGLQLYLYDIKGFLHWAYNFYNNQYSVRAVDPYFITDADGFAPAGDAFQVYPAPWGEPEESLRHVLFGQALQDHRALMWLASLTDRDKVLSLIEEDIGYRPTMTRYPRDGEYLLGLRHKVNAALEQALQKRP